MTAPAKIIPETFVLSGNAVTNKSLFYFLFTLALGVAFFIYFSQGKNPKLMFGIFFALICFSYGIISIIFARYPVGLEIIPSANNLKVDYLNGFGVQKRDTINLNGAFVRYTKRFNPSWDLNDMQTRITQNIINSWIYVDKTHGFSQAQIKFIYDSLKSNR
jgi:hypothetical protein